MSCTHFFHLIDFIYFLIIIIVVIPIIQRNTFCAFESNCLGIHLDFLFFYSTGWWGPLPECPISFGLLSSFWEEVQAQSAFNLLEGATFVEHILWKIRPLNPDTATLFGLSTFIRFFMYSVNIKISQAHQAIAWLFWVYRNALVFMKTPNHPTSKDPLLCDVKLSDRAENSQMNMRK